MGAVAPSAQQNDVCGIFGEVLFLDPHPSRGSDGYGEVVGQITKSWRRLRSIRGAFQPISPTGPTCQVIHR